MLGPDKCPLGNTTTLANMNGAMVAEQFGVYYHASICWPDVWREKKYKWSTVFFMALDQACGVPFEILKTIDAQERPKKLALAVETTFGGEKFANACRDAAQKNGFAFFEEIKLPVASKDYSTELEKIRKAGVDGMFLYTNAGDCEPLIRQMKKANVTVAFLQTWKGGWAGKFWKDLGMEWMHSTCSATASGRWNTHTREHGIWGNGITKNSANIP